MLDTPPNSDSTGKPERTWQQPSPEHDGIHDTITVPERQITVLTRANDVIPKQAALEFDLDNISNVDIADQYTGAAEELAEVMNRTHGDVMLAREFLEAKKKVLVPLKDKHDGDKRGVNRLAYSKKEIDAKNSLEAVVIAMGVLPKTQFEADWDNFNPQHAVESCINFADICADSYNETLAETRERLDYAGVHKRGKGVLSRLIRRT